MSIRKKKGFTLIELVAVLVIMAIIALIVTPLVMNIIKKAKTAADKRSIDAYGRSIELAIAGYLMDTGDFPTSIDQLTIEYSGDEVVCSTTQIKSDSSIYLAGCTVGGRSVDGYTYGDEETITYETYEVGDQVTYNNVDYRVIKDSGANESTVTLLKATPLTVAEVTQYGAGHINRYTSDSVGTAYDYNNDGTVGGMAYYTSATCGYNGTDWVFDGCTTDYAQSEVKYAVDAWKQAQAPAATSARLITYDELVDNLGYNQANWNESYWVVNPDYTPSWVYNNNFWYWTMSQYNAEASRVWDVCSDGALYYNYGHVFAIRGSVRPVITLSKTNISS